MTLVGDGIEEGFIHRLFNMEVSNVLKSEES